MNQRAIAITGIMLAAVIAKPGFYTHAAEAQNKPPDFLFSADNQINQTAEQAGSTIVSSNVLHDNQWLNEPLTRLDYVLVNIQNQLNINLPSVAQEFIRDFFERAPIGEPSAQFSVRYSSEKGRLIIGAKVDTVGKPKKPMKEFCERMLGWMALSYPLQPMGYSWQNNALGILMRDDADKYVSVTQDLAKSAVLIVSVSSGYTIVGKDDFFHVSCMRQNSSSPITFSKYSAPLSKLDSR